MMDGAPAQVWSYAPQYRRPRHFHAESELNIVVHGSARFGLGSRSVDVRAGDVLGFPAGQDHVMLQSSSDLVLFAVGAKQALGADTARVHSALQARPRERDFAALAVRAEALAGCADGARAAELWHMACALALRYPASPTHVLTRRALALVRDDLELGRAALAKHAQCHPTELSRHFHRDVGVTLVRYRTRLRLMSLIRSMDAGAGNLVRAALLAGFGSYSQFHRAFRAELSCSPREFFSGNLRLEMENYFEPA